MTWRRWTSFSCFVLAASLAARPAAAQLAPTGGHYAGRPSDTGYAGAVNSSGGYGASVPLDLPAARGGLPIPLHISYSEHGVGAAGAGWDVPLSYIQRDTTFARRRPAGTPEVDPQPREQVSLVLEGRRMLLVRTASGWAAQRDAPDLAIREQGDGTWVVFDGQGWTYLFTVADPALTGAGLWHLASVTGPGGNKVALTYAVGNPSVAGAPDAVSIDLDTIQYNPDSSGCYKHAITLGYDAPAATPLSIAPLGGKLVARVHPLLTIAVSSRPTCGATLQTLRSYRLTYVPDVDTRQPRLSSVQMTGRQGTPEEGTLVPVTSYTYGSASNGGQLVYQSGPDISESDAYPIAQTRGSVLSGAVLYQTHRSIMDLTGDGRPDLIHNVISRNTPVGSGGAIQFLGLVTFLNGELEERQSAGPRYGSDPQNPGVHDDSLFQQVIDVDGDGRLDVVRAISGEWLIDLNTPDPVNPGNIVWQVRSISTVALAQHLRERGLWDGDDLLPLASRTTRGENVYSACIRWDGPSQRWVEFTGLISCQPGGSLIGSGGPQVTITAWELKDINGDGYPDVVFNSSPVSTISNVDTNFDPPPTGDGTVIRSTRALTVQLAAGDANEIDAVLNIAGIHLSSASGNPFSAPVTLRSNAGCGVARWAGVDDTHQQLVCNIVDVNGDGIADFVNGTSVFLGTGNRGPGSFFTPGAMLTLPGPLEIQSNSQVASCVHPATGTTTFPVAQLALLRDLTGDGIPDYVTFDASGHYAVSIGTGTGFGAPMQITGVSSVSGEVEDCAGTDFRTELGLYDLDGDGKADVVWSTAASPGTVSWARLVGSSGAPGAPDAGRLVQLDNGYGAQTRIIYQSAKEDAATLHQVPFPEIVVSSVQTTGAQGLGGNLTAADYAYGGADLMFDPALDTFTFPGYRRMVELRVSPTSN